MANKTIGSGLNHAQVRTAADETFDIEAVVKVEGSNDAEVTEIKGDDVVKGTFYGERKSEITVEANAMTLDMLAAITGNTVTTGASPVSHSINIGTNSEDNPPLVELSYKTRAKNPATGAVATIEITYHKVQLMAPPLAGALGDEFSIELSGTAYKTATDIEGNALSEACLATFVSVDSDTTV